MDRYINSKVLLTGEKKRYYETILYPKIEKSDTDIYMITNHGDRLDVIAYEKYGDVSLWYVIALANGLVNGSVFVPAGTQLRVPMNLDQFNTELNSSVI